MLQAIALANLKKVFFMCNTCELLFKIVCKIRVKEQETVHPFHPFEFTFEFMRKSCVTLN